MARYLGNTTTREAHDVERWPPGNPGCNLQIMLEDPRNTQEIKGTEGLEGWLRDGGKLCGHCFGEAHVRDTE